ncbi:hypothetical protein ACJX0J_014407, partial [Zea mays]
FKHGPLRIKEKSNTRSSKNRRFSKIISSLLVDQEEQVTRSAPYISAEDLLVLTHPANSKFVDQHTSPEEDFPSADRSHRSVGKVEKLVTSAPPPLSTIGYSVDVADGNEVPPPEKKECEYRNGTWVSDNRRPLYSGLTQRKDFTYEKFRWQPEACEMPEFEASQFLRRMQDKAIAYVGDSLGRQMFQSMMYVGAEYGFVFAPGAKRPDGWPYRFPSTNTTILYHWSSTLCDLEPLNPSDRVTKQPLHAPRPGPQHRGKMRANRWEMYLRGTPNSNRNTTVIWKAKNFTVHSVVSCDNTSPLAKGGSGVHLDRSEDADAEGAVRGTGVRLLDVTALSRLRDEGHISRYNIKATPGVQDCLVESSDFISKIKKKILNKPCIFCTWGR